MGADIAGAERSDWQASATRPGSLQHAVRKHCPCRHELSASPWLTEVRLPGAEKLRLHRIDGGDTTGLLALLVDLGQQASTKLGRAVEVACCFEAGRDGFWLHRLLTAHGVAAYVLEPTSILVNRRARRAKTDRLDAEGMLRVLAAWLGGDRGGVQHGARSHA